MPGMADLRAQLELPCRGGRVAHAQRPRRVYPGWIVPATDPRDIG